MTLPSFLTDPRYDYSKVPPITNERLAELMARIKPVVERGGKLFYIEDVDPRGIAFTWDPVVVEEAVGLVRVTSIPTRHNYGAPAFFKPSIAEVLAQIPDEFVDVVTAFETLTDLTAMNIHQTLHHTTTLLYRQA